MEKILAALEIIDFVLTKVGKWVAETKAKGDPVSEDVLAQIARRKATLNKIDAIANG